MVVDFSHRYVFIQNAFTASTAVGKELVEQYGGQYVIFKHASYAHFMKWAGEHAKDFFVFSTIRHPMDMEVSAYHKRKNNHNNNYTKESLRSSNGGWISRRKIKRFNYINDNDATFAEYFKRFFHVPYCNQLMPHYERLNYVMRFEQLQSDFSRVLNVLGIEQKRPLPVLNVTKRDSSSFEPFYTEDIRDRAVNVFGPQMKVWGYDFPSGWEVGPVTKTQEAAFKASSLILSAYLRFFIQNRRVASKSRSFEDLVATHQPILSV